MRAHAENRFIKKFVSGNARKKTKEVLYEDIKKRAYEIFLSKGGTNGHDVDDWMEAEREIMKSNRKTGSR